MIAAQSDDGANAVSRQPTAYVSPSDDIMSPCTKKLSDIKGKRFKKYVETVDDVNPSSPG
jgi:hypothetical protein